MKATSDESEPLYFYTKSMPYWGLSNFSPPGFELESVFWPTVEHYYQAQKFVEQSVREKIRNASTAKDARNMGQSRVAEIRQDWDTQREAVMLTALRAKFKSQGAQNILTSTGCRPLIEASPYDHYWGCGQDGTGLNRLGILLEQVRREIQEAR